MTNIRTIYLERGLLMGSNEKVTIRNATLSDFDALFALRVDLQKHLERLNPRIWHITEKGKETVKTELKEQISNENGCLKVALKRKELIGFAYGEVFHRLEYKPKHIGKISLVFVKEAFRRRGVGTLLIRELCRYFSAENIERITLRHVLGNEEAENFWCKLGFEPILVTSDTRLGELKNRLSNFRRG